MSASPAEIVAAFLVSRSLVVRPPGDRATWPVTDNTMPEEGLDNWVTVYDTGSDLDGVIQATGETIEHPTVAVRVRGLSASLAYVKGKAISSALAKESKGYVVVLGGMTHKILGLTITVGLTRITQDEKNRRQIYTLNARMTLRSS